MRRIDAAEVFRFGVNGIVATGVHFLMLTLLLYVFEFSLAGFANALASLFGITCSFFGSRYYVYPRTGNSIASEFLRFGGLYASIAVIHGAVLFFWTDVFQHDYRTGFLIATVLQVSMSYLGNKKLVFS